MQNTFLFSSLLSKNIKTKTYKITVLPVFLNGCDTCVFGDDGSVKHVAS
jgi:hypothetical protein